MRSKFLKLNARDFFKGMIVAVITGVLTFLIDQLPKGAAIDSDFLKRVGIAAVIAFLSYLLKNLFTNSSGDILKTENNGTSTGSS